MNDRNCISCRVLSGELGVPGGFVYDDELVVAYHRPPLERPTVYIGHLMVVPRRHVRGLAELSEDEAAIIGLLTTRLADALERAEGADHVYSFVFDHEPHHHRHVIARYPGAPREFWGMRVDDWPEAPTGGFDEAAAAAGRIRAQLQS